jgi:putative ABC transport system permease protein
VTVSEAAADVEPIVRRNADPSTLTARVAALVDEQLGSSRAPLFLLLGASALLMLIACANVAGLLLGDARAVSGDCSAIGARGRPSSGRAAAAD